jgi:hypothetical protein
MIQFNIEEQRNLSKNIKKISYQLTKEIRYLEKSIQIYISTDISNENEDSESITNFFTISNKRKHESKTNLEILYKKKSKKRKKIMIPII